MNIRRLRGITALELMVTMAIVAILLATGVPTFKNYTWNLRMKTAMDSLQSDLNLARGLAISHNIQTIICPADDGIACSGSPDWKNGWIVFSDLNSDRARQAGEPLRKHTGGVELLAITSSRKYLRFYPNGSAPGSNTSIRFCDQRGAQHAGKILVSNSGRIRMETNGIKAYENCP